MRRCLLLTALLLALPMLGHAAPQPLTSAITYQGQLKVSGVPANGSFDLRFTLYSDPNLNIQAAPPITIDDLAVANGLITVSLDFGFAPAQAGNGLFLGIEVRDGASAGAYAPLAPLVELRPQYFSQYRSTSASLRRRPAMACSSASRCATARRPAPMRRSRRSWS